VRRLVSFFNRIAGDLRPDFPRKRFSTIFYTDLIGPPEESLSRGSVAYLALYERCYGHALGDPSCARNSHFLETLRSWEKAYTGMRILYEYYTAYYGYASLPLAAWVHMKEDFETLGQLGVVGLSLQSTSGNFWAYWINCQVFARLGWKKELDVDSFLKDLLNDFFGEAAPAMIEYFEVITRAHRTYRNDPVISTDPMIGELQKRSPSCFIIQHESFVNCFTSEVLEDLEGILTRGEKLAEGEVFTRRLERERVHLNYMRKAGEALSLRRTARLLSAAGAEGPHSLSVARRAYLAFEQLMGFVRKVERDGVIFAARAYKVWKRLQRSLVLEFGKDVER